MSFSQISVAKTDCYQLLTNGTIKQLIRGSDSTTWKPIDTNPLNVQVVANTQPGLRHRTGAVYKRRTSWVNFGTRASKLWGWDGGFWQWQETTKKLWYEGSETGGVWEVRDANVVTVGLLHVRGVIYQLTGDGTIKVFASRPDQWGVLDEDVETVEIATDTEFLYKRRRDGSVYQLNGGEWDLISGDTLTVQIAGGEAGLFRRLVDGRILQWVDEGWQLRDSSSDNIDIAVAVHAYRVGSDGDIYELTENGIWELLGEPNTSKSSEPEEGGVQPEEVYNGGYSDATDVLLRIGNGGAGQSGLVKVLADEFIKYRVSLGSKPFKVAWYKSDTTESIKYLQEGVVDVGITYTPAAEDIAIRQGIALDPKYYAFREHFLLLGPPSNPAKLDPTSDIVSMFSQLYTAAEAGDTTPAVRFLSRYDKSATNIKDSELWIKIGQVPWATKYSTWYHQYMAYPIQALKAAVALEEYTLTDWGTYLSEEVSVENDVVIYKKGGDDADNQLLAPAHLLVGAQARDVVFAQVFAAWLVGEKGQAVVTGFKKKGQQVYSGAPGA